MTSKQSFSIGKLVNLRWRLGIAVKSSSCSALNAPFVSLLMEVEDGNQKKTTHTLELTLAEFQVTFKKLNKFNLLNKKDLAKQFQEMATLMDTLS